MIRYWKMTEEEKKRYGFFKLTERDLERAGLRKRLLREKEVKR
jgi:hypothetical protein